MMNSNGLVKAEVLAIEEIEFEKENDVITSNLQMMAKDSSKSHAG